MPSETPVHDYVLPRLRALVADAIDQGFDPLTVTAVVTDILASTDMLAELGHRTPDAPERQDRSRPVLPLPPVPGATS